MTQAARTTEGPTIDNGPGKVINARMEHVERIHELITYFAERNRMLFRSLEELYQDVRNFRVYVDGQGRVQGCCGLQVLWRDMAEVKSLAVDPDCQGKGIGRALVLHAVEEARELGLPKVFALTYEREFFLRLGFVEVKKETLPHKVWTDCIRCPSQNDCREVPVVMNLRDGR